MLAESRWTVQGQVQADPSPDGLRGRAKPEQVGAGVAPAPAGVESDEHLLDLVAIEADHLAVPSVRDANAVMTPDGWNTD
jgi:CxxC motif-containing protein (DUF1111 family)